MMRFLAPLYCVLALFLTACAPQSTSDPSAATGTVGTPPAAADSAASPNESGSSDEPAARTADAGQDADKTPERSVAERAMDPSVELPEAVAKSLANVENDPDPDSLVRDSHYWVSNENFHFVFRKHIDDHGGIFAGVGTDQNYLMAAWAKSPIIIMIDFDEQIRNVHELYGVILRRVETADALRKAWRQPDKVEAWIAEDFDEKRAEELTKTFDDARGIIYARLRKVAKSYTEREIPTFLTDPEQFAFIRDLWRRGRVVAFRGDLTGSKTMVQLGRALEEHGLQLGMLYTSNAEQYFPFTPEYRRNVIALPSGPNSLVLRTRPYRGLGLPKEPERELDEREQEELEEELAEMTPEELEEYEQSKIGEYHYNVQPLANLQKWLKISKTEDVLPLLRRKRANDEDVKGLSVIEAEAKASKEPPEIAPTP